MNIGMDFTPHKIYRKKIPCDEKLRTFFTLLPKRDCLFARILYFTDMRMCDLLNLKVLDSSALILPEHLVHDLNLFINGRELNEFVFSSKKNIPIQRAHVYQAFERASISMKCEYSLKVSDLCEWEEKCNRE
jgi:hypothetical protein